MTKREIFAVASKIFGIYLLVRGLVFSAPYIVYLIAPQYMANVEWKWLLPGLIPFVLYIFAALFLIIWAEPIAAKLSGKEEPSEVKAVVEKDSLQQIAFSAVGVFMVATALPRLTQMVATLIVQVSDEARLPTWGAIVGIVLQMAIGIYLFFGSKGLVGILKKLKAI